MVRDQPPGLLQAQGPHVCCKCSPRIFGVMGLRWSECVPAAACRSYVWTSVRPSIHGHISSGPESLESSCTVWQHGAMAVSHSYIPSVRSCTHIALLCGSPGDCRGYRLFFPGSWQLAETPVGLQRKRGRSPDPHAALGRSLGGPHWSCARCQHCRQENCGEIDCPGQPDHDHVSA